MNSYKPPYIISDKSLNLVVEITNLISKVDKSFEMDVILRKKNRIKTITGTLAIEGNTLDIKRVTALLDGKKVLGTKKEIAEVYGAIETYKSIDTFSPYEVEDLLKAHYLMMNSLINDAGVFRDVKVAVKNGDESIHVAPPPHLVNNLILRLFDWLKTTEINPLISSCVFHYELEFIHPFIDGNGRIGRFWQTLILSRYHPSFAYFPIESVVKEKQLDYYIALNKSDDDGKSTIFIEFMLECILEAISSVIGSDKSSVNSDKIILKEMSQNNKITIKQLSQKLQLTTRAIEKQISKLKKENKIKRVGSARKGEWVVL